MVMIDLVDEKKSLGVISVTRVTDSSQRSRPADLFLARSAQFRTYEAGGIAHGSRRRPGTEKVTGPSQD